MGFKKLNKKAVQFSSISLSIIAVSLFIIAAGVIVGGWTNNYSTNVTSDLNEFNKLNEISSITSNQQQRLSNVNPSSDEGGEAATFRGAFGIVANIFAPFALVFGNNGLIDLAINRFGLPSYVRQGLIAMIISVLVFSLVAIVFRSIRSRV